MSANTNEPKQNMKAPAVTALIANHNYGNWIADAVQSVVKQSYPVKQFCVIDDRSTDDSVKHITDLFDVVKEFSVTIDEREYECINGSISGTPGFIIKNVYDDKKGPAAARNLGFRVIQAVSPTEVHAVLDADDFWMPDKIITCVSVLMKYPAVAAVYTDYDNLDVETGALVRQYKEAFTGRRLTHECIVHSGCFFRSDVFIEVGGFDEQLRVAEDWALWKKMSKNHVIYHVPKSLSVVRVHPQNSTNSVSKEVWNQCWAAVSKI